MNNTTYESYVEEKRGNKGTRRETTPRQKGKELHYETNGRGGGGVLE